MGIKEAPDAQVKLKGAYQAVGSAKKLQGLKFAGQVSKEKKYAACDA